MSQNQIHPATFPKAAFAAAAVLLLGAGGTWAEDAKTEHPGAKVYRQMCADCHGKNGEGIAGKHDEPLVGRRNVPALAKYISKSMPEDKEGSVRRQGRG